MFEPNKYRGEMGLLGVRNTLKDRCVNCSNSKTGTMRRLTTECSLKFLTFYFSSEPFQPFIPSFPDYQSTAVSPPFKTVCYLCLSTLHPNISLMMFGSLWVSCWKRLGVSWLEGERERKCSVTAKRRNLCVTAAAKSELMTDRRICLNWHKLKYGTLPLYGLQ